jgi:hypothetical protein
MAVPIGIATGWYLHMRRYLVRVAGRRVYWTCRWYYNFVGFLQFVSGAHVKGRSMSIEADKTYERDRMTWWDSANVKEEFSQS